MVTTTQRWTPNTANSAISAILQHFEDEHRAIPRDKVRTHNLKQTIRGMENEHYRQHPKCNTQSCPLYLDLIPEIMTDIHTMPGLTPRDKSALAASVAFAYAFSPRPSEFLLVNQRRACGDKYALTNDTYFWYNNQPYPVTEPHSFPDGTPNEMSTRLGFHPGQPGTKADQHKAAPDRTYTAPPDGHTFLNLMPYIHTHMITYPPAKDEGLFIGSQGLITDNLFKTALRRTAKRLGIDPARLRPQSGRAGAVQNIIARGRGPDVQRQQGQWASTRGLNAYKRPSFAHSRNVAADIATLNLTPISAARHFYPPTTPRLETPRQTRTPTIPTTTKNPRLTTKLTIPIHNIRPRIDTQSNESRQAT